MSGPSAGAFRSAVVGFAITAAFVSYQILTDPGSPVSRNPTLMITFLALCPPSLLSIAVHEPEVGSNSFYFLWGTIGLLNGALYAAIRTFLRRWLQRPR